MPNKRLLILGNIDVPEIERLADIGYAAEVVGSGNQRLCRIVTTGPAAGTSEGGEAA